MQGEVAKMAGAERQGAMWIIKNLGIRGLYKGATACLSRDVPFSAIYFPTYAHLKKDLFKESPENKLGVGSLLISGAIAGMPAAYLTTPFDVVKTRLQTEARKGESSYTGMRHAFRTIYAEEGFRAFFKGGPARILRSSPQFGFTLAAYEVLQGLLPMPGGDDHPKPTVGMADMGPLPGLRSRNALKVILDLDVNFGKIPISEGKPKGWLGLNGRHE
jgi:solute carrier family 25 aspartate/glutamate transporter 12/13